MLVASRLDEALWLHREAFSSCGGALCVLPFFFFGAANGSFLSNAWFHRSGAFLPLASDCWCACRFVSSFALVAYHVWNTAVGSVSNRPWLSTPPSSTSWYYQRQNAAEHDVWRGRWLVL
jgi:hypothetical protein